MAGKSRSAKYYAANPAARKKKLAYDKKYQSSPTQKKNRAARNAARKKLGLKKGDTRDASHKRALSSGGSNAKSNLKAEARSKNRGRK